MSIVSRRPLLQLFRTAAARSLSTAAAVRSTAASGSQVYESSRAVSEYLLFHYGQRSDMMPYSFGPADGLDFPARLANLCVAHTAAGKRGRALDIGCSVGGSAFELSRSYQEVVGIDFSQHFVDAANTMRDQGQMEYEVMEQGNIFAKRVATLPSGVRPNCVQFEQGDATALPASLGTFDVILASNLLCRLPQPRRFLDSVPDLLNAGGALVLVSPYSWLEEYTPVENWLGAKAEQGQGGVKSYDALQAYLKGQGLPLQQIHQEDMPFVIREHQRKFQYGVSDAIVFTKL